MAKKKATGRWDRTKVVLKWGALGIVTYELYMALVVARQKRRDVFNLALQSQSATSKPLFVIGDPDAGFSRVMGRDFDCGDKCFDERACAKCEGSVAGDIAQALSAQGSNSAVVFVNGKLESAPDVNALMGELQRVSGGDLFVVTEPRWRLMSLLPPRKRWVMTAPPATGHAEYRDLPWLPGPSTVQRTPLVA